MSDEIQENQHRAESNDIPTMQQPMERSHEEEGSSNNAPQMNIAPKSIPNWLHEVLAWIKRIEMADSKLTTSSWIFKQLCWPKLHGKVKAHWVQRLTSLRDNESPIPRSKLCLSNVDKFAVLPQNYTTIPIASIDPPEYIIGFEQIHLRFLDGLILEFLERMLPNFDLPIRLQFRCEIAGWNADDIRIGPIHRLLSTILAPKIYQLNLNTGINLCDFNRLFPGIIEEIQLITLDGPRSDWDLLLQWLNTERADGEPKALAIFEGETEDRVNFIDRVKQEFLLSKQKAAFIIELGSVSPWEDMMEDETFENEATGEVLTIYRSPHWDEEVEMVLRYMARHPKEMEEYWNWEKKLAFALEEEFTDVGIEIEEIGVF